MNINKEEIIKNIKDKLGNHTLLYLTVYGSHLYGLSDENSDIDIRGIYLPSMESCILNKMPQEIHETTGQQNEKNTSNDVDINLFSIQKFIKLCSELDSNGTDMYFSQSHKEMIIYKDPILTYILDTPNKIMNLKTGKAYVSYAIAQAARYGIKGSRLGLIRQISQYVEPFKESKEPLETIVNEILDQFNHQSYCFMKAIPNKNKINEKYLVVCGACHQLNITIQEFFIRIQKEQNKYGWRSAQACDKGSIDWKSLSHAVRVLYQCLELYNTGVINFPLKQREEIFKIKKGELSFEEVENTINRLLEEVDIAKHNCIFNDKYLYNEKFILKELREMYKVV